MARKHRTNCNISVSLPKSEFGKRSISYLSHVISAEGIRAIPKVAKGGIDLSFPKSHKDVLSFLGSLNYYHKFIEYFLVVAEVLYEDQIHQERDLSRAHESFELLKRKISLGQEYNGKIHPVRYTRRVLNDAELRYHIAEKGVIAILRALQVFRTILEGRRVIIYTRYPF
ncbi:hypothetical protein PHMEG_00032730 [Phytophthora megakarya]|uniref:Reverse transcriptase RNase H-like domain-containing protein n=1 Tax=Phytophthora megakarya TaxID=4795 RepID=A0A225UVH3_9STRA|nr:hypothetical protein PHMEG_00032730 [Phytophthora megakarya]